MMAVTSLETDFILTSLRREVEDDKQVQRKENLKMKFLQSSEGGKERVQKNINQIIITRQKQQQKQINHNLSVKPYLVSFRTNKFSES